MNAASYQYYFFSSHLCRTYIFFRIVLLSLNSIGNSEQRNVKTAQGLAKSRSFHIFAFVANLWYEILQSGVSIRQRIGKGNSFIFLLEIVLELQLESFLFKTIPANPFDPVDLIASLLAPLSLNTGIRPHSMCIQIFLFAKITNVELYLTHLFFVAYFEVKPSSVSSCVGVTSQKQVVFIFLDPYCHVEITAFKCRIEADFIIT